ncbi:uncharacterized protein CDAR_427291 [Caerostris darwini]|uniref:Secreted protein n=1 Tax=Caerostris darwini TaxID=1538125 RepID=A0AAV4PLN1_9ARAC|nr:uncharacterized protein CDAR_427291 [Caerostris darwini]
MFVYAFIFLGLWGVLATDENCSDQRLHGCFPDRGDVASFPGTEEELRQLCSYLRNGVRCLENVKEDCGLESHDQERMEIVGDFTRAICQEGSRLYTNIVENLACLKERIENDFGLCRTMTINNLMSLHEHLEDRRSPKSPDRLHQFYSCLYVSLEGNCFLVQAFKKCGVDAKDTALEVLDRAGIYIEQCPTSLRLEIEEMLEILALGNRDDIFVKDLLV